MSGGVASAANAFAAQNIEYKWLASVTYPPEGGVIDDPEHAFASRLLFLRLYGRSEVDDYTLAPTPNEAQETMTHLITETALFREGTPVFVTAEVMDLVNEAVEEMPSEVLLEQDLPMRDFVMWFEQPLEYLPQVMIVSDDDEHGELYEENWQLDAIGVKFTPKGVVIRTDDQTDLEYAPEPGLLGRIQLREEHPERLRDGVLLFLYVSRANLPADLGGKNPLTYRTGPYVLIDLIGTAFDVDWATRNHKSPARAIHKWLIAMMRLMGEHIEVTSTGVARPLRRAAERSGRTLPPDGYLSVMHLRRVAYGHGGAPGESMSERKLRWRHRVRGHWHRYYLPSRKLPVGDPGAYRVRYVNSFVRGPRDAKLVESHRVVAVDR